MNFSATHSKFFMALLLASASLIYSCYLWGQQKILSKNFIYRFDSIHVSPTDKFFSNLLLRDRKEDPEPFETRTEQKLKSSAVCFVSANDSIGGISTWEQTKCNAIIKGDTLRIEVGYSDGFTGQGVTVVCIGGRFTSRFHFFFDSDPSYGSQIKLTTEKQKLSLDKLNYTVGDSLFGTLYIRQASSEGIKYYASGYFRTKIEPSHIY